MPRPGPRPYECVRRAWHSDRHQPMRGSIIQQIFRVVNDAHSSATKKNREWQEKLPIVVLRAEEIMYSKANSEAEYMDLGTLWERVNDAINTIIRRDESSETGELLPPCIEAALNLGCVPVRASRSQRHSNPRSYLTPRTQEPTSVSPRILDNINEGRPPNAGNQLTVARLTTDATLLVSDSDRHITQNNRLATPQNFYFPYENFHLGSKQSMAMETNTSLNFGSVYPLYYGTHFQNEESQLGFQIPANANANTNPIFVGTPIGTSSAEPSEMVILQNLFSFDGRGNVSNRNAQADFREMGGKEPITECDLSLRLGPSLDPCMRMEKCSARDTEDVGSSSSQDGAKISDPSPRKSKGFCDFARKTANSPLHSCSSKWNSGGEGQNVETTMRKRKAPFNNDVDCGEFLWQSEIRSDHFTGQIERPGL